MQGSRLPNRIQFLGHLWRTDNIQCWDESANHLRRGGWQRRRSLLQLCHRNRVYFWTPGFGPTLQQCQETSRIFMEIKWIWQVVKRWCHFLKVCFRGKGAFWLFGRAPSAPQKALQKSQKDLFLRKRTIKMKQTLTLGKSSRRH